MLHQPITKPWNHASAVTCCQTCEGEGTVRSSRRASIHDPFPEDACPDCDGPHAKECAVCGSEIEVPGFDCIACQAVADLPDHCLNDFVVDELAAAMKLAICARLASVRRAA